MLVLVIDHLPPAKSPLRSLRRDLPPRHQAHQEDVTAELGHCQSFSFSFSFVCALGGKSPEVSSRRKSGRSPPFVLIWNQAVILEIARKGDLPVVIDPITLSRRVEVPDYVRSS